LPGAGGAGEVGRDEVGAVAVEGAAGPVVAAGLAGLGVSCDVLYVSPAAAGGVSVDSPAIRAGEQRCFGPFADRRVDGSSCRWVRGCSDTSDHRAFLTSTYYSTT